MKHDHATNQDLRRTTIIRKHRTWRAGLLPMIALALISPVLAQRRAITPEAQTGVGQLQKQPRGIPYQTFFYKSGDLNIEAYFYKPQGNGPFPLVIYNHGSRAGQEQ